MSHNFDSLCFPKLFFAIKILVFMSYAVLTKCSRISFNSGRMDASLTIDSIIDLGQKTRNSYVIQFHSAKVTSISNMLCHYECLFGFKAELIRFFQLSNYCSANCIAWVWEMGGYVPLPWGVGICISPGYVNVHRICKSSVLCLLT